MVRRSKLEMYISILEFLSLRGPMKTTHLMYKTNMSYRVLMEFLDKLIDRDLVEQRKTSEKRVMYAITQKGTSTIRSFRQFRQILSESAMRIENRLLPY